MVVDIATPGVRVSSKTLALPETLAYFRDCVVVDHMCYTGYGTLRRLGLAFK